MNRQTISIRFAGAPTYGDEKIGVILMSQETTILPTGAFADEWSVYPVTIVQARYSGSYEGASWLCFPVGPQALQAPFWSGWDDSDGECMEWWDRAAVENYPIGRGHDAASAYHDLVERLLAANEADEQ